MVRLIGPAKALRMMATAVILTAAEAEAMGVIDLACPEDADFDTWFAERVKPFRDQPRQVARAYKSIASGARGPGRAEADIIETRHFGEVWAHEDHWSAVARLEK